MDALGSSPSFGAAERLEGLTLPNDWKVQARIRRDDGITGSTRSACYRAISRDGTVAFVKAFDFRREEMVGDTEHLERMVREFNHEKNVHYLCRDRHINRVTRIYEAGKIIVDNEVVNYLICEWIESCLREIQPPGDARVSASERFIALRNTASAAAQLHGVGVAHQDIKPSNAVCSGPDKLKLTDLGSSSCENMASPPHDQLYIVGQPNYAPYELLYEDASPDWRRRHIGCDLFLLGNLCFTSFVGGSLTILATHAIPSHLRHTEFTGDYAEVIPHLIEAHHLIVPNLLEGRVPKQLLEEVVDVVLCLCHPNPLRRGHTKNLQRNGNEYGLERFVTRFDVLAIKSRLMPP